jgi:hypothetical protein
MRRNFSGWGVIFLGILLALGGAYGLWAGWDLIQLERGWSQFIAGSVALSGGVMTIALGRILTVLTSLKPLPLMSTDRQIASQEAITPLASASAGSKIEAAGARTAHQILSSDRQDTLLASTKPTPPPEPTERPQSSTQGEAEEVDRYSAGDTTYIMFSDGSVEVRKATGSQRFPSLAALRAATGSKRR